MPAGIRLGFLTMLSWQTRNGTNLTVGGFVPSAVVMLTSVISSTGQVRIEPV